MTGVLASRKYNRYLWVLMGTYDFPWLEWYEWEVRHEAGSYFRSSYSQEWNPAALYFLSKTLDLDLPWLLFQFRCFQPSVSAKALDGTYWRRETLYILYIFNICVKFKLCGKLCHWTSHHSWSGMRDLSLWSGVPRGRDGGSIFAHKIAHKWKEICIKLNHLHQSPKSLKYCFAL